MNIILASKSPRRKDLLGTLIKNFEIITCPTDESTAPDIAPDAATEMLAVRKGDAVYRYLCDCGRITEDNLEDFVIISSDTLVAYGGRPLGKPSDAEDAVRMLTLLSGKTHSVHTGVAVRRGDRVLSAVDTTLVTFRNIEHGEIIEYVDGGEPMDKAGAYGIQGEGGKFVLSIDGEYDTVVGLSMKTVRELLDNLGAL
jgi:septum formation protein